MNRRNVYNELEFAGWFDRDSAEVVAETESGGRLQERQNINYDKGREACHKPLE